MLGVSGTPVLDAVGKLGDLRDRLSDKRTFSTTIRSDGDYPLEGIPLGLDSYYTLWDGR